MRYACVLAAVLIVPGCLTATAHAQTKKTTPAKPSVPAKPASTSVKPGGAAKPGGTSTAGHSTATTGPRASSAGSKITTAGHPTTTAGRASVSGGSGTHPGMGGGAHSAADSGHPGMSGGTHLAAGSHTVAGPRGTQMTRRADGRTAEFHDPGRGMTVHHGLNGGREVRVDRADHSRVYGERGGRGYVQHPYMYRGREFGHRTYYDHGRYYDRYYRRYGYHGVFLDVYAPAVYWGPGFYGWAYNPWAVPVAYGWGWGAAPWYGFYGAYFTPYPVYPGAAFWLTDYMIAASLQDAYAAQAAAAQGAAAQQAAADQAAMLTPEVKAMVADEVKRQLSLENNEAGQNAQGQDIDPASSGIARMLGDGQPHVFIAGASLDLTDTAGTECAVSQGDVIEVAAPPAQDAQATSAVVLASKGGNECRKSDNVTVALNDLQDMQNHMRESIDQGLGDLQKNQGQGGLPQAPPSAQAPATKAGFTADAPAPDTTAGAQIAEQTKAADQDEQEVASATPPAGAGGALAPIAPPAAPEGPPPTLSLGQTISQVTAINGQPTRIVDLGTKKIYIYKDMKVTFTAGKVSAVQ
jgi:hypothetical protein